MKNKESDSSVKIIWHKVLKKPSELPEGRVMSVSAGHTTVALTHYKGKFSALDNKCPHQGGPLGEGSIEKGCLRCPWHGWDYHPQTGKSPGGFGDGVKTYLVKVRKDGVYIGIEKRIPHKKTVSDVMVETMVNWGIDSVFGMVGHSNLGLADAFRRQEKKGNLKYIGIRHEGAASFAASAYGKLSGKPAACFSIAGPGATNMLTGLWDAKVDRAPILALTGQINSKLIGRGAFQEIDLKDAYNSVSKWSQTVNKESDHAEFISLAIKSAIINRDVAHLIFPDEVQEIFVGDDVMPQTPKGRLADDKIIPTKKCITSAINLIKKYKRPIIIVGYGARNSMPQIIKLAEKLNAPIITTFKAKGQISNKHPLACGVLGRSGTPVASWFMNKSDSIIVFGASFSNHTGITQKRPTIQIDFDRESLARFHAIDVPVWGEIGVTVNLLIKELRGRKIKTIKQQTEIAERWSIWRKEKKKRLKDNFCKGISSARVFDVMSKLTPKNAVITVDVGNNAYSFGRYFECKNQTILMSGYLGSIGFAYPAAMGAWAASGDRPIIAVSGDGGFGQYMAELTTAVAYKMPIKHILLNNSELGKISKEQKEAYLDVYKTSLHNPNFAEYAKNCGALGIRVTNQEELKDAMKKVFDHKGPAMLEIMTDALLV